MRAKQFIIDDIDRRGFLGGLLGAAGVGTLGYQSYRQKTGPNAPGQPTSDGNRGDMATSRPSKADAPTVTQPRVQKYSTDQLKDYIIDYAQKYLPANQVIPFIAQVSHESHSFRSMEENLNYSAERLSKLYPKLFPPKLAARVVASSDRDRIIANTIYGNRMGNSEPGDGYKYRGRGYIQLTGRENYEKMGKLLKIDLVDNPDLAARPDYAAQIAVSYWNTRVANKTNTNNIAGVTKKISGSSKQGIKSRTEKLKKYTRELGDRVLPKKKSK
jgi:putative chitinase